jgi:nucleotide-binding universal stress UspA family protein
MSTAERGASGNERDGGRTVVGVDGSAAARTALTWAFQDAARRGARLDVRTVFPVQVFLGDPYLLDDRQLDAVRSDSLERASALVEDVRAETGAADVPVEVDAIPGDAASVLLEAASDADLLVVGNRGRGAIRSVVLGSVALTSVAHAHVPVVVVHPTVEHSDRPGAGRRLVVVGLDGSVESGVALERAAHEARLLGGEVLAVAAYSTVTFWSGAYDVVIPEPELLAEEIRAATERQVAAAHLPEGVPVRVECREGPAGAVLVQAAEGADLLVVGGHGQGPVRGLLMGSVALHCVLSGPCPVMVIPRSRERED